MENWRTQYLKSYLNKVYYLMYELYMMTHVTDIVHPHLLLHSSVRSKDLQSSEKHAFVCVGKQVIESKREN